MQTSDWHTRRIKQLLDKLSDRTDSTVKAGIDALQRLDFLTDSDTVFDVAESLASCEELPITERQDFARIAYLSQRKGNNAWNKLLQYALLSVPKPKTDFAKTFPICRAEEAVIPRKIRQCRPNIEPFSVENMRQTGFFSQNRDFDYQNYDFEIASAYLDKNLGQYAAQLFADLGIPQAQSDFFLIAALFYEGGVSADVCTVARAAIDPLLSENATFGCVLEHSELQKKFLFATARHPFIAAWLEQLTAVATRVVRKEIAFDYEHFSSRGAFQRFFLDDFCKETPSLNLAKMAVIEDPIYASFIDASTEEENLPSADKHLGFKRSRLVGLADDLKFAAKQLPRERGEVIIASVPGQFISKAACMTVVGDNKLPEFLRQATVPYAHPAVHLFQTHDVVMTGHGSLWKDGRYLRLDSYLSQVAENEVIAGHWLRPNGGFDPRVIEEPVVTAYGAGFGCYGHWLADDLPRLALARELLGENEFLKRKIVLPKATPQWGIALLDAVFKISPDDMIFFDHEREMVSMRDAVIPSFLSRHYRFHPVIRRLMQALAPQVERPWRRVCFSRSAWEVNKIHQRVFQQQAHFEELARQRGFEIIQPEKLSFAEQIQLFAETRCQIGEHGSAQHASVFNGHGMTIGTINPLTEVQTNLGRLYGDRNIVVFEDSAYRDEKQNYFYEMRDEKLVAFFDAVERADANRNFV